MKKTNLVSTSKATTENDKNVSTKIVAATFENNLGPEEALGERVFKSYVFSDARKSDYSMEKAQKKKKKKKSLIVISSY